MSDKTPKVKLNESHRNEIWTNLSTMKARYDPLYNEARGLRVKFKKHMALVMNLRIFANRYGTKDMVNKFDKLYHKFDKIDSELYSIVNKLETLDVRHAGVNNLFSKYTTFCNK